jgi:hypothetical protein
MASARRSGVETLRRIWIQQFCHEGGAVGWREAGNVPPAALFIVGDHARPIRVATLG